MIGKVLGSTVLLTLALVAIVGGVVSASAFKKDVPVGAVLTSVVASTGIVFLLNIVGIWFGRKSFGVIGLLISAVILGYGIYVLATNNSMVTKDETITTVIGATATSVGGVSLLTGLGVLANM